MAKKSRKKVVTFHPAMTMHNVETMDRREMDGDWSLQRRAALCTLTKTSAELRTLHLTDPTTYQHLLDLVIEHDQHLRQCLQLAGMAVARLAESAKD